MHIIKQKEIDNENKEVANNEEEKEGIRQGIRLRD